jgi:hypothetical protein
MQIRFFVSALSAAAALQSELNELKYTGRQALQSCKYLFQAENAPSMGIADQKAHEPTREVHFYNAQHMNFTALCT